MQTYTSRFGTVAAGKIQSFVAERSVTVDGEKITPTESFWSRFSPQRETIIKAPKAKKGEEQQPDGVRRDLDFTLGYYVLLDSGHDRFVSDDEFAKFQPIKEA